MRQAHKYLRTIESGIITQTDVEILAGFEPNTLRISVTAKSTADDLSCNSDVNLLDEDKLIHIAAAIAEACNAELRKAFQNETAKEG